MEEMEFGWNIIFYVAMANLWMSGQKMFWRSKNLPQINLQALETVAWVNEDYDMIRWP